MNILVVDDDPVLRLMVVQGLTAHGHDVTPCESGADAWGHLRKTRYPIVVTDWLMPGIDGLALTQLIRRAPSDAYTYVIMLTRLTKRADYLTAVRAGVDAFLVKPLDGEMLLAQVDIATRILGLHAYAQKLEAIMVVCSYCKRVRSNGQWMPMEQHVAAEYGALPSHTYCPDCLASEVEPELRRLGIATVG